MSARPTLAVHALHCRFPDPPTAALRGVDLEARRGELVVVMGASGAGKSTLLRCISGLVPSLAPAECSGAIELEGEAVLGTPAGQLAGRVAMVFQDFEAQLFSTDVRMEIAFGPEQLGVEGAEIARRIGSTLETVGLTEYAGRDPTTLSGGQKQRLAVASILAMEPDVILLDEAATDLDPRGRRELYATLQRLRGDRWTLVAVEHELEPIMCADRVVLMRDGAVVAAGPPHELARDPDVFLACGVRPHDLAVLGRRLGVALPLDVAAAAAELRGRVAAGAAGASAPPPRGATILEVERLSCAYGGRQQALADVSTTIRAGEFVALIGENGSGKTTLAKHLNGLLHAERGTVRLEGTDVATLPLERVAPLVGYVFQNPDHQLFAASVRDEVAFGPRNFGLEDAALAARVADALDAVGLVGLEEADPFLLSKGERQRLAVATILAMAPRVLILDEPTTGLDYPQQRRMLDLLARLHARGTTIIAITHSPWVVVEYAERALLMQGGRLVFDGPLATLLADDGLLAAAAFEAPPATRLARALGVGARTVEELARALGASPG